MLDGKTDYGYPGQKRYMPRMDGEISRIWDNEDQRFLEKLEQREVVRTIMKIRFDLGMPSA